LIATGVSATRWSASDLRVAGILAVATAVAELFPLHLRHRKELETFSVGDVIWTASLMLVHGSVLVLSVVVGTLFSQIARRQRARKIIFNVAQFALAIWAAQAVYQMFGSHEPLEPAAWLGIVTAMAVYFAINETLVGSVIALAERERFTSVLLGTWRLDVLQLMGNVSLGIVAAMLWWVRPMSVVIVIIPLGLSYLAYAGWINSRRERDRVRNLYEAGQLLLDRLETDGDFGPFLELVARTFDATAACLVLSQSNRGLLYETEPGTQRTFDAEALSLPLERRLEPWLGPNSHVALVGLLQSPEGALGVERSSTLSGPEQSILESLAAQVFVKLRHSRLFAESEGRREQLEDILASTSDGIFALSEEGRVLSWNPAMVSITGISNAKAVGMIVDDALPAPKGEFCMWEGLRDKAAPSTGEQIRPLMRRGGSMTWVRYSWTRLHREGEVSHVVVARDITEELESERAKSQFIAAISHELRTPLTPLKGYLSLLASGAVDPSTNEVNEYFSSMLKQTDRLERLIDDLLDASQIESGGAIVEGRNMNVIPLVEALLREHRRQHPERVFRVHTAEREITVLADPFRLEQVLTNLLSNAIKYSAPASTIDIELRAEGPLCVVAVRDRGPGIAQSEQTRIFDQFYRIDNGNTRRTGGAGLGLFIVKQFVEAMSGRVWVESNPGDGSSFLFTLRRSREIDGDQGPEPGAKLTGMTEPQKA
jgi:PAS domain S-box-containing protein